ncbi:MULTISPECIES: hypothetical protein [Sporosarcina]|uniref:hypothetical protein n=1 Tax=Sporosarcina TaxID=1569 RepID=UPI00129B1245|nr:MULTISPECIES: hypothetical protein [Sporosarcina]GKV66368.1 hypothetical protein NCCP2331_25210 [Sporosarcina sp. NCCP-2331]GLB56485.1 hypothetical protein NCCP2378_22720 [Sporosarcina sp. NCCP-2378]
MMNQGMPGMQGMQGMQGMPGQQPGFPMQPIVCPTQYRYNDCFTQQEFPVIHPIVNVNRHHVVGVPQHYYTESTQDVMGNTLMPGMGPASQGPGGMGGGCGHGHGCGCGHGHGHGRRRRCGR